MYSKKSSRDVGTLYYFRQLFHLVNVPDKVKKNYKSSEALFLSVTKAYICSAFMTWGGFKSLDDRSPEKIPLPSPDLGKEEKKKYLETIVEKFVDEYVMVELDAEKEIRKGKYILIHYYHQN